MVDKTAEETSAKAKRKPTRLGLFLKANKLKPSAVARECGYSRQHLVRLRYGILEPTRKAMAAITDTVSRMLRRPTYSVELFELGEMDEAFAVSRGVTDEE